MNVELRRLSKGYREAGGFLSILNGVDASFSGGRSYGIVGRSGIGKSTLLHIIGGLDTPDGGTVVCGDTSLSSLGNDERARFRGQHVGFIFQFHHLLHEFSAVENVAMPLLIAGVSDAGAFKRADELLARLGIGDRAHHAPPELSGGEQQRVAIARALVAKPAIILCDEPTGSLDYRTAALVSEALRELQRELSATMIVVTHSRELASDLDEVREMVPGGALMELSAIS